MLRSEPCCDSNNPKQHAAFTKRAVGKKKTSGVTHNFSSTAGRRFRIVSVTKKNLKKKNRFSFLFFHYSLLYLQEVLETEWMLLYSFPEKQL